MKKFESWQIDDLSETFGLLDRRPDFPSLTQWLNDAADGCELTDFEQALIRNRQAQLIRDGEYWNEDELKIKFIAPLLLTARFDELNGRGVKTFSQRRMTATLQGRVGPVEVGGVVDFVLAAGIARPKNPYFFIHEFKPENKRGGGDRGQLLIEMLTAQRLNDDGRTLYGVYISGRNWFFCTLDGNEYAFSNNFSADGPQLYEIVAMLRRIKEYTEKMLV